MQGKNGWRNGPARPISAVMSYSRAPSMRPDADRLMRYDANKRSALVAYALWFFVGWFGVHRFYLGRIVSGVVMAAATLVSGVLTWVLIGYLGLALIGLWLLLDALLIPGMVQDFNNRLIASLG